MVSDLYESEKSIDKIESGEPGPSPFRPSIVTQHIHSHKRPDHDGATFISLLTTEKD